MRNVEKITEGNNDIIYLDFSELKNKEDIQKQIEIFESFIKRQPLNSLSTLTNLENMHFNTEIYNAFAAYVKNNSAYVNNSAVIGFKGMMNIFYKGFVKLTGRNVKVCNSKEEALSVLTKSFSATEV